MTRHLFLFLKKTALRLVSASCADRPDRLYSYLIKWVLASCLFTFVSSCIGPEVDVLDFQEVTMEEPQALEELGTLALSAQVTGAADALVRQGFIMSASLEVIEQNRGMNLPGELVESQRFQHELQDLSLDSTYYFKAWAEFKDEKAPFTRTVFSRSIKTFSFNVRLGVLNEVVVVNNSAHCKGFISGLQIQGINATSHGFIFSSDPDALLELNEAGTDTVNLGSLTANGEFPGEIDGLQFNTTYYFRTWALTSNQKFYYSSEKGEFRIRDGWEKMNDYPFSLLHGYGAAAGGKGYFLGCRELYAVDCQVNDVNQQLWAFDPLANAGNGSWTNTQTEQTGLAVLNAASFVLGDTMYILTGEQVPPTGGQNAPVFNFKKIHTSNIGTADFDLIPSDGSVKARSSAVVFVLKNKAYLGTGMSYNFSLLNDFWEYDPSSGKWRQMASLPFHINPLEPVKYNEGRREAIAFSDEEFGYAGGGVRNLTMLKDFWKFVPPASPADTGHWEFLAFFPGPGRADPVSFEIGGVCYFGTGYNYTSGLLQDFWKCDPTAIPVFKMVQTFPGTPREQATGMAIAGRGFAGLGMTRAPDNSGDIVPALLNDMWRYIPE
jgi:N-acetylneuraminic acid mutarotase